MRKVKFGTLNVGDIFFMDWEEDIMIKCMKCDDDNFNTVWLTYKAGALDYCPDNMLVFVQEEDEK